MMNKKIIPSSAVCKTWVILSSSSRLAAGKQGGVRGLAVSHTSLNAGIRMVQKLKGRFIGMRNPIATFRIWLYSGVLE